MMKAILDSSLSGSPSAQLPFSSELLGLFLQFGYAITGSVPWYGLHLTVTYLAALTTLVWIAFELSSRFSTVVRLVVLEKPTQPWRG